MTRQANKTRLTEFDLMMIRSGGRTQAEQEVSFLRAAKIRYRTCAFLADGLYKIVMRLEASANRSVENTHRRFSIQAVD
ncbi:MAG: hypothetical protein HKO14_10125 [Silicimonas sp.]|nr:hypothetical protein [Silicimonas sp.]